YGEVEHASRRVFQVDNSIPSINNGVMSKSTISHLKCVVCGRACDRREMHSFTTHPWRRPRWINAVRSTPEGRRFLMERLSASSRRYLCASHFSPSDYTNSLCKTELRFEAVPFFEDSVVISSGVDEVPESVHDTQEDIKKEPVEIIEQHEEPVADKQKSCALFEVTVKEEEMEEEEPGPSSYFH
ncbi:hypothetical protein PMAYCL1PPCAC_13800, partial [Pristionchus mayeri]